MECGRRIRYEKKQNGHTGISVYKRNGKKTAKREWQSVAQAAYDSRMWRFVWRLPKMTISVKL